MVDEKQMRDAVRELLASKSPAELNALVAEEGARLSREVEAAKAPPSFAPLPKDEWARLSAFLADMGGDKNWSKAFFNARVNLEKDDQEGFIMALLLLYKACRLSLPHLEP